MAGGRLVVISAPSGSGKTTIAREIMKRNTDLAFSVSATTRKKRAGEVEGKDYYFLDEGEFSRKVAAGEFVEWEEVYGDRYGTLKSEVERLLQEGRAILFDVDVKGALSIKRRFPDALLLFIAPPGIASLRERLRARHTEDSNTIERRLARVPMELEAANQFDHRVVNDNLQDAIEEVQQLVRAYLNQGRREKQ